jgi:hypothetical protein
MAELPPLQGRYLDKTLDTQLALWSALIQVEALLVAVAPILALMVPPSAPLSIIIILTALVAGTLLVWNFLSTRNIFLTIGQTLSERRAPAGTDVPQAGRLFREVRTRERAVLVLLVVQIVLLGWVSLKAAYR